MWTLQSIKFIFGHYNQMRLNEDSCQLPMPMVQSTRVKLIEQSNCFKCLYWFYWVASIHQLAKAMDYDWIGICNFFLGLSYFPNFIPLTLSMFQPPFLFIKCNFSFINYSHLSWLIKINRPPIMGDQIILLVWC